jgi:hypothetical protein
MNRCDKLSLSLALAGSLAALMPAGANAQTTGPGLTAPSPAASDGNALRRNFPQKALRGQILFGTPPAIRIQGVVTQMATAYRIHGYNNLLVMSAQLVGVQADVDYTTDLQGQVNEVWILTPAEVANQPWPSTPAETAAWSFDPIAQTWTKP